MPNTCPMHSDLTHDEGHSVKMILWVPTVLPTYQMDSVRLTHTHTHDSLSLLPAASMGNFFQNIISQFKEACKQ